MLWTILICSDFVAAVLCALGRAERLGGGFHSFAVALMLGSVVGTICAAALWLIGKLVWIRVSSLQSNLAQNWCLGLLYLFAASWLFFSCFLGNWITTLFLVPL
jgi:hypothetical protein